MARLSEQRKQFEAALSTPEVYSDSLKFTQTETSYKKASEELALANAQYEKVFEQIVELEARLNS